MKFKEISVKLDNRVYTEKQAAALKKISGKLNNISRFFERIAEFENLILKNIYVEYLNLIRLRESRTEIEKIGGAEVYINDYFLKSVNAIKNQLSATIEEWDSSNEDLTVEDIKVRIEKLKEIKARLGDQCKEKTPIGSICDILDSFAHFKIYKIIILDTILDKIELLLSFKNEMIEIVDSGNITKTIKDQDLSIDDL